MLWSMGSQRDGRNWATELNWQSIWESLSSRLDISCHYSSFIQSLIWKIESQCITSCIIPSEEILNRKQLSRDQTCIAGEFINSWTTREALLIFKCRTKTKWFIKIFPALDLFLLLLFVIAWIVNRCIFQAQYFKISTSTIMAFVGGDQLSCVWLSCDRMDGSLPGSSVQGISQARILEWAALSFSRGSSRDGAHVFCTGGGWVGWRGFLYHWATREAHYVLHSLLFSRFDSW